MLYVYTRVGVTYIILLLLYCVHILYVRSRTIEDGRARAIRVPCAAAARCLSARGGGRKTTHVGGTSLGRRAVRRGGGDGRADVTLSSLASSRTRRPVDERKSFLLSLLLLLLLISFLFFFFFSSLFYVRVKLETASGRESMCVRRCHLVRLSVGFSALPDKSNNIIIDFVTVLCTRLLFRRLARAAYSV